MNAMFYSTLTLLRRKFLPRRYDFLPCAAGAAHGAACRPALIKDWPLPDKVGWKIFVRSRARRELFFGCSTTYCNRARGAEARFVQSYSLVFSYAVLFNMQYGLQEGVIYVQIRAKERSLSCGESSAWFRLAGA